MQELLMPPVSMRQGEAPVRTWERVVISVKGQIGPEDAQGPAWSHSRASRNFQKGLGRSRSGFVTGAASTCSTTRCPTTMGGHRAGDGYGGIAERRVMTTPGTVDGHAAAVRTEKNARSGRRARKSPMPPAVGRRAVAERQPDR
jgi:hypothetical protein